jgi:hypothetical protein
MYPGKHGWFDKRFMYEESFPDDAGLDQVYISKQYLQTV